MIEVNQMTGDVQVEGRTWPLLFILITTFKRSHLAVQTIEGLKKYLRYAPIAWHIADDGTPDPEHIPTLIKAIGEDQRITTSNSNRGGVGKSKNLGLQEVFKHTPLVLMLEDDWVLSQPLDLYPHVDVMLGREDVGMIRFGFLGGPMDAHLDDMHGPFSYYLTLKQGSGVYIYSGQVGLRHKRFYDICGYHDENTSPGEEELEFCRRYNRTENAPLILWPSTIPAAFGPFRNRKINNNA
jgi:hypothetical protein